MTTIAFDGKTLAVDSMANNGTFITSRTVRKMWGRTGEFLCVVMAGPTAHYPPILRWLESGANPEDWKNWGAVAWVVKKSGKVMRYIGGYPEHIDGIDGDGSGAELALGAMATGASARVGLEIASRYDIYTGGPIHVYDIERNKFL